MLVREPVAGDADALHRYHERNAARLERFDPSYASSVPVQQTWIADRIELRARGTARTFVAFLGGEPPEPIAIVAFDAISSGGESSAIVSFSIDRAHEGRGVAYEITRDACAEIFEALDLHAIVAYHHPANARSSALLRRLGFRVDATFDDVPADLAGLVAPHVMAVLNRPG